MTGYREWTEQDELEERGRVATLMQLQRSVFVFGSNLAGRHGAGAAHVALVTYGAKNGLGEGLHGRSYALPTKDADIETLPLWAIREYANRFRIFAELAPTVRFVVTRVGCGLAGYRDEQMAPLFYGCTPNVELPTLWRAMAKFGRL